jgi:hypothetical protein
MTTGRLLFVLGLFAVFVFTVGIAAIWTVSYGPL